jgi:L-arabinose isomerase
MSVTWVDEFALRARHGIEIVPLECSAVAAKARGVGSAALAEYRAHLERLGATARVGQGVLERGMRLALAVEEIADERGLAGLALNDIAPELHVALGSRPCLPSFRLCERGFVVSMEADIAACAAMLLLARFTGEAPFYSEVLNLGPEDNWLLMGHAGWHDPRGRDPVEPMIIGADEEYRSNGGGEGAALIYKAAAGPVTAINSVFDGKGLRWTVFEGESLPGPARLEGYSHLVCRTDEPVRALVDRWIERGVSQHWVVVPGRRAAEIATLCRWAGIPCER